MARYVYHEVLGRGGMGVVHRATQVELGRDVALKILADEVASDEANCRRFIHEIEALTALQHPHIIRILDCGQLDGRWFYAMELISGRSLEQLRKDVGPLEARRALRLARQMADALAHCHAHGIVHRDVKPANAMVAPDDHLTLMDFGIVRIQGATVVTAEGVVIGTPRYIAPEVIRGQPPSPAADVYALGVTLYELLSPVPPFEADEPRIVLGQILRGAVEPILQRRPELAPGVAEIVGHVMAHKAADRPTASALVIAIDRAVVGARRPSGRTPALGAAAPRRGTRPVAAVPARHPWIPALVAIAVLGGGLTLWRWPAPRRPQPGRDVGSAVAARGVRPTATAPSDAPQAKSAGPGPGAGSGVDDRLWSAVAQARGTIHERRHAVSDILRHLTASLLGLDLAEAARRAREIERLEGPLMARIKDVVATIERRAGGPEPLAPLALGLLAPPALELLARATTVEISLLCRLERCRRMIIVFDKAAAEGRNTLADVPVLLGEFETGLALGEDTAARVGRYLDVVAALLDRVGHQPDAIRGGLAVDLEDLGDVAKNLSNMPWARVARRGLEGRVRAFLGTLRRRPPPVGPPLAAAAAGLWGIASEPGRSEHVQAARSGLRRLAVLVPGASVELLRLEDTIARERPRKEAIGAARQ